MTVNPALTATDGAPLDAVGSWTFVTASPRLVSIEPLEGTLNVFLDAPVRIVFSQGMDTASVEANFSLLDAAGQPVSGEFSWDETLTTMTFTPRALLAAGQQLYRGTERGGGSHGRRDIGQRNAVHRGKPCMTCKLPGMPPARATTIHTYEQVMLYLSSPVPEEDVLDYISFSPAVPNLSAWVDEFQMSISLYGTLDPDTNYTLTVSARADRPLGQPSGAELQP